MCPPLVAALPAIGSWIAANATLVMTGVAVASSAVGIFATNEAGKAQTAAINAQADAEREEVGASVEEELGQRIREARERRARARVAAGESGVGGASFAASLNQSLSDSNMDAALASKNLAFASRGIDNRSNTALSQVRSVSGLEAGLSIAGAGLRGHAAGSAVAAARDEAAGGP